MPKYWCDISQMFEAGAVQKCLRSTLQCIATSRVSQHLAKSGNEKKSSSKDLRKIISVAFDIQGTVLRDVELHIL